MECAGVFRKLVMGNLASWEWEEGRQHSGWENLVGHKENFLALDTKVEERGDRNSLGVVTKGRLSLINLLMCGKGPGPQIAALSAPTSS